MKNMRKALSLIMVFAMLCGLMVTTAFASGATEITTVQDLAAMTDGDYILKADITINASDWTPVEAFSGTFDGNKDEGYAITWTGTAAGVPNFSIIGTNMGTVKDLKVDGSLTITGSNLDYFSAVVGYNKNTGVIDGVESAVTLDASGHYNVGGVCGWNDGYILNSANTGAVTGYSQVGGIVGQNNGTVNSCSNTAQVKALKAGKGGVGGIAGRNGDKDTATTSGHIWNCWNSGYIVSGTPGQPSTQGSWIGGICGFLNSLSDCVNCYNVGSMSGYAYLDHISGNTEGTNTNCYGLYGAEGPQGYDGAVILTEEEMTTAPDFVNELSAGASGRWTQTSGSYPVLTNTAATTDINPAIAGDVSFDVTTLPAKTEYAVGQYFDPTGLVVTATYKDSEGAVQTEDVTGDIDTWDPSLTTPLTAAVTAVKASGTAVINGNSIDFTVLIPITVIPVPSDPIYLNGLSGDDGNTGADKNHAVKTLAKAVDLAGDNGIIYVTGSVTIPAGQQNGNVTVRADNGLEGVMFYVDPGQGAVTTLTSMTIDGNGKTLDSLIRMKSGTLRLRGNVTLKNAAVGVQVDGGTTVEVNKAQVSTTRSFEVANSEASLILNDFGGTSITGAVYLASGTKVGVAAAIPCALTIDSEVTAPMTPIAEGVNGYQITLADISQVSLTGGHSAFPTPINNQILIRT